MFVAFCCPLLRWIQSGQILVSLLRLLVLPGSNFWARHRHFQVAWRLDTGTQGASCAMRHVSMSRLEPIKFERRQVHRTAANIYHFQVFVKHLAAPKPRSSKVGQEMVWETSSLGEPLFERPGAYNLAQWHHATSWTAKVQESRKFNLLPHVPTICVSIHSHPASWTHKIIKFNNIYQHSWASWWHNVCALFPPVQKLPSVQSTHIKITD